MTYNDRYLRNAKDTACQEKYNDRYLQEKRMPRSKQPIKDARERLIEAAGRGFRKGGYGGIGVDALAKEAGLTSGAFYAHFGSKADAFQLAMVDGMKLLQNGVTTFREKLGPSWREAFIDFYFGERMDAGLDQACALPSFASDIARANAETRKAFDIELNALVDLVAAGLGDPPDRKRAFALLTILSGGAGMARGVKDKGLRAAILDAAAAAAKAI
jgi:TetR/AcrR family transcriptional regulator, transcriptional repressor for nem operon